jgi:hypothetical protein
VRASASGIASEAKQSMARQAGLLRRFAPRNDEQEVREEKQE